MAESDIRSAISDKAEELLTSRDPKVQLLGAVMRQSVRRPPGVKGRPRPVGVPRVAGVPAEDDPLMKALAQAFLKDQTTSLVDESDQQVDLY